MNNLKIISEEIHKIGENSLSVLIVIGPDGYGVDVRAGKASFGVNILIDKDKAEYVFKKLNDRIEASVNFRDYVYICESCSSILSSSDWTEIVLSLHTDRRPVVKLEVDYLIQILNLDKEERKTALGGHTIQVRLKNEEELYGEFTSTEDGGKYIYHSF